MSKDIFTARKRSLGQGNIFSSMCQEFCSPGGGGVVPPGQVHPQAGTPLDRSSPQTGTPPSQVHPLARYTPLAGTSPQAGNPPGQVHPPAGTPPARYPSGQVHPPLAVHAGRYVQQAGGTHPTGMHSCWNKFLKHILEFFKSDEILDFRGKVMF